MTENITPLKFGPLFYVSVLTGLTIVYTCILNSTERGKIKVPYSENMWLGI